MKASVFFFLVLITAAAFAQQTQNKNTVLLPSDQDPTVSIRVMFFAGARYDPVGKEGLAALTAQMMSEGSTTRNSYTKIIGLLYPLAASYSASPVMEVTTFFGRVHKDNLPDYLPLFMEALLSPAFAEEDFNRIKSNMLDYLNNSLKYSNDEELGKAVLYNEIFKGTPYGHVVTGTISGLNNITLDDVKSFYSEYFNRNNFILGIGGGFDDALVVKVEAELKKLPEGKRFTPEKIKPRQLSGKEVTIAEKQASATAISIGFPIDVLR